MTRAEDVAWAAGLFEGEGCISLRNKTRTTRPGIRFTLSSTDKDVVDRFHTVVGCGSVTGPCWSTLATKEQWRWAASRRADVILLAELLRPHLGTRRLARLEECEAIVAALPEKTNHNRDKTHCPNGHPYAGDNLKLERGGKARRCRTCERARLARRDRARKALA